MEGERYNLEKAQKEAHDLTQRVEFGSASDYPSAEKKIEEEKRFRVLTFLNSLLPINHFPNILEEIHDLLKENPTEIQEAIFKKIASSIEHGRIDDAIFIKNTFNIPDVEILQRSDLQLALKQSVSDPGFHRRTVQHLTKAIDNFPFPLSFWQSSEFQEGLKKYWSDNIGGPFDVKHNQADSIHELTHESLPRLVKIIFPNPKSFTTEEKVQARAKLLIKKGTEDFKEYIPNEDMGLESAADLAAFFEINKDDPDIQPLLSEIKRRILTVLVRHVDVSSAYLRERVTGALRAREVFGFDKELGQDLGKEGMIRLISRGHSESAKIIKEVFGFPDSITIDLFKTAQKTRKWDSVIKLANCFPECEELYKNAITKGRETISTSQDSKERKEVIEMFAGLIINGDSQFLQDLVSIVSERSKDKEPKDTKTGFSPIQEAAFAVLYRLDNPESNAALSSLLSNETIPSAVKRSTLNKLTKQKSSFLDQHSRYNLRIWLHNQKPENTNWNDLSFLQDIENISASESREIAKFYASEVIAGFDQESGYEVWTKQYPDIPKDTFLQLCKFLQANPRDEAWTAYRGDVMKKFQALYKTLRREGSKRDILLSAIASCHNIQSELLDLVVEKLSDINFEKKEDSDKLARILKLTAFLNSIQNIISHSDYHDESDYNYEYEESEGESDQNLPLSVPDNIKEIFEGQITNLSELENLLSVAATTQIQEILPNENITAEKVEKVIEQWTDIEPIFTYLKRHPNLKTYIAEMFASFDSNENWKAWRYNLEDRTVKKQVGHLSPEQLEIWQNNHVAEVGDFEIQEGSSSKPEQVRRILIDAVVRDRHINNEQAEGARLPLAQRILEKALLGLDENTEQGQKNLAETTKQVNDLASKLDVLILSANSSRVEQTLNSILPPDKNLTPSSKIENSLKALRPFLSPENFEVIWQIYKDIPEKTAISSSVLITPDVRQAVAVKLQTVKQQAGEISSSAIWQELELPSSTVPEISTIYQKRAELKAVLELLRLTNLNSRQIALNILTEGKKKEEGSSITSTIDNLKKVFKDSAFMQDLKNIEFILKEQTQFIGKRRLAMVLSDNPSFLWQAGKYPIGNGSCQHYAEGSMSSSLMGYVGDAHIKVSYLFDINSLPENLKTKIKDGVPLGEIINQAKPPEILQAVVARSIVKVGKDERNKPAIFMEPTYSVINKGDISMDRYFNLFTDLFVVEPMKSKLYRGSGSEKLNIPPSRNPEGQYEDGAVGNAQNAGMGIQTSSYTIFAKSIGKDHTPTAEEESIIENMRRSSR